MRHKKLLLSFFAIVIMVSAALIVTALYVYYHPATFKAVVETSFAAKTGLSLQMEDLVYSIHPLQVRATHIIIKDGEKSQGFALRVAKFAADFELSGPFGSRKLIIRQIELAEFSIDLEPEFDTTSFVAKQEPPSLVDLLFRRLVTFFFFADVQIQSVTAIKGRFDLESAQQQIFIRQIHASLKLDKLEISGKVLIHRRKPDIRITFPEINLVMDPGFYTGESTIAGRIHLPAGTVESREVRAAGIQGGLHWSYNPELKHLVLDSVSLRCSSLSVPIKTGQNIAFKEVLFEADGDFEVQKSRVNLSRWHLRVDNFVNVGGNATGDFQAPYGLKIGLTAGRLISGKLISILNDFRGLNSSPLSLSGPIELTGAIEIHKTAPGWSLQGDLTTQLTRNPFSVSTDKLHLDGSLTGSIRAFGHLPNPDLSAALNGENIILTGGGLTMKSITTKLSVTGKHPEYSVADLSARIARTFLATGEKTYRLNDLRINVKNGRVNMENGRLAWPHIRFSSSNLKNLQISVSGQWEQMLIKLAADNSRILQTAVALGLLPADWRFNGHDSVRVTAVIKRQGWSTISSTLNLTELDFLNPDESCLAENMRVLAETSAMVHMAEGKIKGTFSLATPAGEFLCDKIYLDLTQNSFSASGNAAYDLHNRDLQIAGAKFELLNLLALDVHGSLHYNKDRPALNVFVELPLTAVNPVFHHFVSEPYKYEKPGLADLEVNGNISARLNILRNGSDWTLRGKTGWQTGSLKIGRSDVAVAGIDLDLPVWFQSPKMKAGSETLRGRLMIQKLALPPLPDQALAISLKVRPGSISTASPVRLRFQSGYIQLDPFVIKNMVTAKLSVHTGLSINSIMLDPLLNGLWPNKTDGIIHGKLDRINYDGKILSSQGTITADIFGGRVHILDPEVSALMTGPPVIKLNVRLDDLKLAPLTEGTAFGKIQGVLAGYINNLEIVNGEAQRFDLQLKTRRKKDVPQKINVRAVENIARLGGGQSPFMGLAGTVVSFFKEFSYKKIGVAASLENDMFTVNGTIRKNGLEYIVKKGGLAGVDVINLNPDNRISFKDMVKRIKRIKTDGEDPVIR
jgi:hypothetical protein